MIFLSHRGLWKTKVEQNSLASFKHSFDEGFGCELDIRDRNGKLVVAHDVAKETDIFLEEVFDCYQQVAGDVPIAINIKADGLQSLLKSVIDSYEITNYFAFDMSVADTLGYRKHLLKFFTRQSEYEAVPPLYEDAQGVWLDCFEGDWWKPEDVKPHLQQGKFVALVSPELHQREYHSAWETWRNIEQEFSTDKLMLCTDYPEEAQEFFNE